MEIVRERKKKEQKSPLFQAIGIPKDDIDQLAQCFDPTTTVEEQLHEYRNIFLVHALGLKDATSLRKLILKDKDNTATRLATVAC